MFRLQVPLSLRHLLKQADLHTCHLAPFPGHRNDGAMVNVPTWFCSQEAMMHWLSSSHRLPLYHRRKNYYNVQDMLPNHPLNYNQVHHLQVVGAIHCCEHKIRLNSNRRLPTFH